MFNKKRIKELEEIIEKLSNRVYDLEGKRIYIKFKKPIENSGMKFTGSELYIGDINDTNISIQEALQLLVDYLDVKYKKSDNPKLVK